MGSGHIPRTGHAAVALTVVAGALAASALMATTAVATPAVATFAKPVTFTYWKVPGGVQSVHVELWGAQGWSSSDPGGPVGGRGAHVSATLEVIAGEKLAVGVGQKGGKGNSPTIGYEMGFTNPIIDAEGGYNPADEVQGGGASGVGAVFEDDSATNYLIAAGGGSAGGDAGGTTHYSSPDEDQVITQARSGDGGDSGQAGSRGADIADGTLGCSDPAGEGGTPGTGQHPGAGGAGGTSGCASRNTQHQTGTSRNGRPGHDGDQVNGSPPAPGFTLQGAGGGGVGGGVQDNSNGFSGGSGGGGWHGGAAGGGGADSQSYTTNDDYSHTDFRAYGAGEGGGGGGSDYASSAPELKDVSTSDGARTGDGKVEIHFDAPGVDIVQAPDETTNQSDAAFEFASQDTSATFECSLDGSEFAACASGQSYSGLTDGQHHFKVRGVDGINEQDAGGYKTDPISWDWTIDTHPPVVHIDQAPSGVQKSTTATFAFGANEAHAAFTCSLDDGAREPCSSPQTYPGLAAGPHSFSVDATDAAGNTSAPKVVTWQVGSNVPAPTTSCPAGKQPKASQGNVFVVGRTGTCLTKGSDHGQPTWTATGLVTVNGIPVDPDPGTAIVLSGAGGLGVLSTSGPATIKLASLPDVHVPVGFEWDEGTGGLLKATKGFAGGLVKQAGGLSALPIWPKIDLSDKKGGSAKIALQFSLPSQFSSIPGSQKKVSVDLGVDASNDDGVFFAGKVKVGKVWAGGGIEVKDLELAYDGATDVFEGSVGLGLGSNEVENGLTIHLGVKIGPPPTIWGPFREASVALQDIDAPIGDTGLFLQEIGMKLSAVPGSAAGQGDLRIAGTLGLSAGPEIPVLKQPAVSIDGEGAFVFSDPWKVELSGEGSLLQFPIADGSIKYTYGKSIELEGHVDETIAGYGFKSQITNSFFQGRQSFNVKSEGDVTLPFIGSQHGTAIFSSAGAAACAEVHGPLGTYALGWGVLASGQQVVIADSCDLGQFEVSASAAASTPPGTPRKLTLKRHHGPRVIAVHGRGKAPSVTLEAPGGTTLSSAGHNPAGSFVIPDQKRDTTFAVLPDGPAGNYTITSKDEIVSVQTADSLPRVRVSVKTRALRRGRRRLTYSQKRVPGQHLELYEQGHGGAGRLLVKTSRTHGRVTFTPRPGLGRKRSILAITVRHGLPRDRRTLAPYGVSDKPPAKVRGLRRKGRTLSWRASRHAVRYAVAFAQKGGAATSVVTKRHRVRIPKGARSATVVPVDALGRAGPKATLALTGRHRRG